MSLRVEDLHVRFGERRVLEGSSLSVATGRTLAVRGPSGFGKTTLLRAVSGLVRPDRGRVYIDGSDVTDQPTHRRAIGFVFQDSQLFPHLDVAGNIAFGLRMQGLDRRRVRAIVDEWLDRIGLADHADQNIHSLSGGETRRVALARALAPAPKVLLLDEPFTGLDTELRERLANLVRELLHTTGTTTLLVSHDDDDVARIAHDVFVLGRAG
ncbi:MAG: Sulfate/thiosulfate import ATP-binding protein CysA [Actinomycetota bacterium]